MKSLRFAASAALVLGTTFFAGCGGGGDAQPRGSVTADLPNDSLPPYVPPAPPTPPAPPIPPAPPVPSAYEGFGDVRAIALDAASDTLWALDSEGVLLRALSVEAGAIAVGWVDFQNARGLTFGPDGMLFAVTQVGGESQLARIDITSPLAPKAIPVGPITGYAEVEALAYESGSGVLYATDIAAHVLLAIDQATGAPTEVGPLGVDFGDVRGLAAVPATHRLYGADRPAAALVEVFKATGAAVGRGTLPGSSIEDLAFSPNRGLFYALDADTGQVVTFDAGALPLDPAPLGYGAIASLALDAEGHVLYGVDVATNRLLEIAPITRDVIGSMALPIGMQVEALAFDPATHLLFASDVASGNLALIDPSNAAVSFVGPMGFAGIRALGLRSSDGELFAVDSDADQVLAVSHDTGAATAVTGDVLAYDAVAGMTYHPASGLFLAVDRATQNLLQIDVATGLAALVGSMAPLDVGGMALDSDAGILYVVDMATGTLVGIDALTGAVIP